MRYTLNIREDKGRWRASAKELPGITVAAETPELAMARIQAAILRRLARDLETGKNGALSTVEFVALA